MSNIQQAENTNKKISTKEKKAFFDETLNLQAKANLHSATCFLNSFFKEWPHYQIIPEKTCIIIPLTPPQSLIIPLKRISLVGRHLYTGNFFIQNGLEEKSIEFSQLVEVLSSFLQTQLNTTAEQLKVFQSRVFASLENIKSSLESYASRPNHYEESLNFTFKEAEQSLLIGHNFHPTPKSRDEFSEQDTKIYSPEFAGHFSLRWLMAHNSIVYQKQAEAYKSLNWNNELLNEELSTLEFNNKDYVALPMHPWQYRHLLNQDWFQQFLNNKLLIDLGEGKPSWSPTSSVRSIYREDSHWMLKFSLSVKVTNSIRHLLPHEVERGLQLCDVLHTNKGQEFVNKHPQFKILQEPAYMCLKNSENQPYIETIVVIRENLFTRENLNQKAVLATLTQDSLINETSYFSSLKTADDVRQWFQLYLKSVVIPLVDAQANYGIILGAHQQNLILDLTSGSPQASYFRDCQGTGYSEVGFKNFSQQVKSISRSNGNIVSEKMGNYLFAYYLILNSSFNVIAAITAQFPEMEKELLANLRLELEKIRSSGVQDSSFLDYILQSNKIMHKGNFLCSLKGINENTTVDPLAIYNEISNPLIKSNIFTQQETSHA